MCFIGNFQSAAVESVGDSWIEADSIRDQTAYLILKCVVFCAQSSLDVKFRIMFTLGFWNLDGAGRCSGVAPTVSVVPSYS